MSFVINGLGYHLLVHALPVQVAQQSSLTGFVLRAVGMMYLVDMDDTPGHKLTIVLPPVEPLEPNKTKESKTGESWIEEFSNEGHEPTPWTAHTTSMSTSSPSAGSSGAGRASVDEINQAVQEIIEDAKKRLDALTNPREHSIDFKAAVRTTLFAASFVRPKSTSTTTTTTNPGTNRKSQDVPPSSIDGVDL
jgi:hypothetical protein